MAVSILAMLPPTSVTAAATPERVNNFDNPCGYSISADGKIPAGIRPCNADGYKFNSSFYYKEWTLNGSGKKDAPRNLIVYGDPDDVPSRSQDYKKGTLTDSGSEIMTEGHFYVYSDQYGGYSYGEYRYLGYTLDGSLYYNSNFINDDTTSNKLGDKHWVFQPWKSLPGSYSNKPSTPGSVYQLANGTYDEPTNSKFATLGSNMTRSLGFNITKGVSYADRYDVLPSSSVNSNPRNYMAVSQAPTTREAGLGTMFHFSWVSNSLWYQSFQLERLSPAEKNPTPVMCSAISVDKQPIPPGKERKVPVKVKITGTIQDQLFYGSYQAESLNYTRKDVAYWKITVNDKDKSGNLTYSSNKASDGVIVKDNTGTATATLTVDTDKLIPTTDPKVSSYKTTAQVVAYYANNGNSNPVNCNIELKFQAGAKGTMLSSFDLIPQVQFQVKSTFTKEMIGYADLSYGKDVDYYTFEISNDDDGTKVTKTFDPAIPEVQKPKAGYLDQDAVRKFLTDFILTKFQDTATSRIVKTFQVKQTIVDRDETTNNTSVDMHTIVVIQDFEVPPTLCGTETGVLPPPPPQYISPAASWPVDWYDVVPFPVTDAEPDYIPAATCEDAPGYDEFTKTAFIDGKQIDVDDFFAGNYIFGEDHLGLHEVKVVWTAPDGTESFKILHTVIHESKPRVSIDVEGLYKENRTMIAKDTSASSNDKWVEANAPLQITSFSYVNPSDPKLKYRNGYGESNLSQKMFMYKGTGSHQLSIAAKRVITYGNGKSITRYSDPYVIDYEILPDYNPAIIAKTYGSEISRLDSMQLFYDVQSVDGDFVASKSMKVFYDSDNDGTFETKVFESTGDLSEFPVFDKLGQYQYVVDAKEGTDQDRLMEFIDAADDRTNTFTGYFFIDNYEPSSDLYLDVPNEKPDMDVYFMLDSELTPASTDYFNTHKVDIANAFTTANMLANIGIWDMKTYTFPLQVSTSKSTGGSYPDTTITYSENGYSGTLTRTSVSNNPYSVDEGHYNTVTDSKTATGSCSNTVGTSYDANGNVSGHSSWSSCPSSMSYSDGKYSGTLSRTGQSLNGSSCPSKGSPNGSCSESWTASYSGTVYWTHDVWVPNMVSKNSYTGYYSGTIYKDVRQPYDASFMRPVKNKYVIYVSDNTVSQLSDLQNVMNKQDAKLILIGSSDIQSQISSTKYIENNKPVEQLISDVIAYIAESNPETPKVLKLVGDTVTTHTATFDYEKDPTPASTDQLQIIQDADYYDNSLGYDIFGGQTISATKSDANWKPYLQDVTLYKPGKYTFYRRVQDLPTTNPLFANYAYWSNESAIEVFVHRRPIADVTLDFDYDINTGLYRTKWVDKSYDLDHNITRAETDRGIQDRTMKFTDKKTGEAFTVIPATLPPGTYDLDYVAQDIEGAWSDPVHRTFVLPDTVPVQFKSNLKATDSEFSLASIPASEQLTAFDMWTRFPYSVSLSLQMPPGGSIINKPVAYYTGTKSGNDINWDDETMTIPATTPDGPYNFRIQANGSVNGSSASNDYTVNVFTPINLVPIEPAANSTLVVGYPTTLTATTTKYPSTATATLFYGTSYAQTVSLTATTSGSGKTWKYNVASLKSVPDGNYVVRFTATNPSGKFETKDVPVKVTKNTPPVGNFKTYTYDSNNTTMPFFEGDTVHIDPVGVGDNEHDTLSVNFTVKDPAGSEVLNKNYTWNYVYPTTGGPTLVPSKVGTYTVTMTISDGKASPVTVTHTLQVKPLGILGTVSHTPQWEANRISYNEANPTKQRSADTFWAGEQFVLASSVTDTGSSLDKADSVSVTLIEEGVSVNLLNTSGLNWTGTMWKKNFDTLEDGTYNFRFTVNYSNGVVKSVVVPIKIKDDIWDEAKTHRVH